MKGPQIVEISPALDVPKPWPGKPGVVEPSGLQAVYLKPGELLVTRDRCQVTTVLGSCVAVTMFHAKLRYAAICHGMLPGPASTPLRANTQQERFKYLSEAITFMAAKFRALGAVTHEIEVKMFGGGNVLGFEENGHPEKWIGTVNIQAARNFLEIESLSIKTGCVGGKAGRKILFNTQTGDVFHRFL